MYYVMDYLSNPADPDDEGPFLEIHQGRVRVPGVTSWHTGARFPQPVPTPILIEATPRHGFKGPPHDYFDGTISFMSTRMVNVIQAMGVDNIDLYPAMITYTNTGERHQVFAFNLLGLVSATDLGRSNLSSHDGDFKMDTSIRGFEVDPSRARALLMFRLAENCVTVLVQERIKNAVEAAGIRTFAFVEPRNWSQF